MKHQPIISGVVCGVFLLWSLTGCHEDEKRPVTSNPTVADESAMLLAGSSAVINVLANDSDPDGDALTIKITAGPFNGTATVGTDNTVTYTPNVGFFGTDTITYTVEDGKAGTATGTVTILVDRAPVATGDSASTGPGTAVEIDVLANDSDPDGDALTIKITTGPSGGTATVGVDNTITYTPNAGFFGTDTFTYTIDDGKTGTATATVSIAVNSPPVATDDAYSVSEDGTLTVLAATGVLANDTDPEGSALTASLLTDVSSGTLTLNADGSFTYKPNANFDGKDIFTYTAFDGTSTATATVTITVNPINDTPVAAADSYTLDEDVALTKDAASGVLANDTDAEGTALTASLGSTNVSNGTLTLNADGSFTYTPNQDFNGSDEFTYNASDGALNATATVTITVNAVNDTPVAKDDPSYTVDEDKSLTVDSVTGILANDTDVEGTALSSTVATNVSNGTLNLNTGGGFTYTPKKDFNGTDTFTYTVSDGSAADTGTATITVKAINDKPIAGDDSANTAVNTLKNINVLANDQDVDNDPLTVTIDTAPTDGTATVKADKTIDYSPNAAFQGADSFKYKIDDGNGQSDTATVSIGVSAAGNNPPTAANDPVSATEDGGAVALSVLANDTDPDANPLTVTSFQQPANGTVTLNADGTGQYTPNANFSGTDTFTYVADDGNGGVATGTVTVTVTAVPDAPVAGTDTVFTNKNVTKPFINILANDTDADGDTLTVTSVTQPATGTVVLNTADNTLTYTPQTDFAGADNFTYTLSDGTTSVTGTVNMTVNTIPVATNDSVRTVQTIPAYVPAAVNDTDADGDKLTATVKDNPTNGTVTTNPDGSLVYTPNAGFGSTQEETDSFTYTASDGKGGEATGSVTVNVAPTYTVVGILPIGGAFTTASDLNESAQVVGFSNTATAGELHAYRWEETGGITDLGTLSGDTRAAAAAINDQGDVVGRSTPTTNHAFLSPAAGGFIDLGDLGGGTSQAEDINSSGVIVGISKTGAGVNHAFIRTGGTMTDLNLQITTGTAASALGINNASQNQVVGQTDTGKAYIWSATNDMVELATFGGTSVAKAINDLGEAAGSAAVSGETHAFFWTASAGATDLGILGGGTLSEARGLNSAHVIVGFAKKSDGTFVGILSINGAPITNLDGLIPASDRFDPVAGTGWELRVPTAVNNRGQIVGNGRFDGISRGFLLKP